MNNESQACVSVVIPVYNVEQYLERCLQSVLSQTYENIDIVLLNDGSTDNSGQICQKFAAAYPQIRYFYHDNMGLSETRNKGIEIALGEFITFLDADDWIEPHFIDDLLGDMLQNGADIGLCDMNYINAATTEKHVVKLRFTQAINTVAKNHSVINKSRLFACGKLYRRSLFLVSNLRYPDFAYEDICTPLVIASASAVSYIAKPLFNYTVNRPGSLSNTPGNIRDLGRGLVWLKEKLLERGLFHELYLEYKKIVLAQYRFAVRRFGHIEDMLIQEDLYKLGDLVGELIPALKDIRERKYYVPADSPLMKAALDCCLPFAGQIVDILSDDAYQLAIDEATVKYSMAELLMEVL